MDLSRKLGAGAKDSVVSRAADKSAHQPPSPEHRPHRIEYTHTPFVEVPARVLERHRIAVVTKSAAADAFRLLRTQVLMQMRRNGWQTLAVTSPNQGAGKSTVSLNLAISIGMEVDYTALLIDADLRDPDLRNKLHLAPGPGLADYLVGKAPLEDLLIHPNIGNLVVLPGGAPIDNTSELMGSPMMAEMVREIRNRYPNRLIVFDVPANLSGADTLALSSYIDATILVVEEHRTTPDEVEKACELFRHSNLMGVVLNKSRELPRVKPSRRRQRGLFSRVFAARDKDMAIPAPPAGKRETSMPDPAPDHRNGVPRRKDPSTTVSGALSDSFRERNPAPLATVPGRSKRPRPWLLTALLVGTVLSLLAVGAAWVILGPGTTITWPSSLSLTALEVPLKQQTIGQLPEQQGQSISSPLKDGGSPVKLVPDAQQEEAFNRSAVSAAPRPTPTLGVTTKNAEPLTGLNPVTEVGESVDTPQLAVTTESGVEFDEAIKSAESANDIEPLIQTDEVSARREVVVAAGSATEADEPEASQAVPVEMETAAGTEEVTETPEVAVAAVSATEADEPAASQAVPVEMETAVGTEEVTENLEVAVAAGSATEADKPAASQVAPVEMKTAAGTEEANENPEVVGAVSATEADEPEASQVAPVEIEAAAGTEDITENPEIAVAAGSATEADESAASQAVPVEMETATGTEEITENSEVAVAAGSVTEADERAAQLGLYHRSVDTPASEMNDDRATNLRSASTANGVQEVPVPETAGVNPPEFRDASQDRPEPQLKPPEPEVLAPSKPPTPFQAAQSTQSQLDLDRLVDRGDQLLALGDVASARLFYRLAATKGSASGATAMGSTYDPIYLERIGIVGVRPSPAEAIKWYRQGIDMGHREGEVQLRELINRLEREAALGDIEAQRILEGVRN